MPIYSTSLWSTCLNVDPGWIPLSDSHEGCPAKGDPPPWTLRDALQVRTLNSNNLPSKEGRIDPARIRPPNFSDDFFSLSFVRHLERSNKPSSLVMMMLRDLREGKPIKEPRWGGSGKGLPVGLSVWLLFCFMLGHPCLF